MKTNWKNKAAIVLAVLSLNSVAIAREGGGGDGSRGGETVDVSGIPRLRDLVDNTVCSWVEGEVMMRANPKLEEIFKKLTMVDWYFAQDLKQEIRDLNYCRTGPLVRVDTRDAENLVAVYNLGSKPVAIRLNGAVYIDQDNMEAMPMHDQAFLLIHEAVHSYMDYKTPMRNQKLRSMVKAIESVYKGNIATTRNFHFQLANNSIDFPLTVHLLAGSKDLVTYVASDYDQRREMILKLQSVETFFKEISELNPGLLAPWHQDKVRATTLDELATQAIHVEDIEVLAKLLDGSQKVRETTMAVLYTSENAEGSQLIRDFLQARGESVDFADLVMRDLALHVISVNESGRVIVPGMNVLATNGEDVQTPFIDLEAHSHQSFERISTRMKVLLTVINSVMQKGDLRTLGKLTFENPEFYEAFSTMKLKADLAQTIFASDLEKTVALRKVETLYIGFWQMAKAYLTARNDVKKWTTFVKKIDQQKLGYEIK